MRKIMLYGSIVLTLICACSKTSKQTDKSSDFHEFVEVKGFVVPADSIDKPMVVTAGKPVVIRAGRPKIVVTNTHVAPVGVPEKIIAGKPEMFKPGTDSMFIPSVCPAVDSLFPAGIPELVPVRDAHIKDNNPQNFSSFTKLQGLRHNNIFCIMQDNSGNLWFGTGGGGACRYDGKYFAHFTEKEGLGNDFVTTMLQDRKGAMWFGTWGGGLCRYDGRNVTRFTEKEGLSFNVVHKIFEDQSGNIWIGMMNGSIARYDGVSFTRFMVDKKGMGCPVKSIAQDNNGTMWFGTLGNGVFSFDGKSFTHFTHREGLGSDRVYSICFDKSGNTWFGLDRGACLYDGRTFQHFTSNERFSSSYVFSIICEKNGSLWFATDTDGVFMFDGNTFTRFTDKEGLGNNSVYSLFQDRSGNIWLGGNGSGVSLYNGRSMTHFTEKEGLSDKRVLTMLQDKSGDIWFGTWGGGACRFNGNSFTHYTEKEGLSNALITAMCQEKNGNIWFGTFGEGAVCYDGKSFIHFTAKEGLAFDYVESIIQDTAGNIWFATNGGGACRYDGKTFVTYSEKQGLSFNDVMYTMQDSRGNLWFATSRGGVNRFDGRSFTHFTKKEGLSDNYVSHVFEDKNGNIWFGTNGGGAICYDGKSAICFTEKDGLCSNSIKSIIHDNQGNLWFGSPNGVSKLPAVYLTAIWERTGKEDNHLPVLFKNYTYEDGLLGISCFAKALFCDRSGTVWIGTSDRLTAYHPEGDESDTTAPNIQLTGILLFNENISWLDLQQNKDTNLVLGNGITIHDFRFDSLSRWHGVPESLSLAYNNNFLTFSFIGITLKHSKKVKYRYKLDGLDENWSGLTTRTEAPYGNIPGGTYTFKVKAMNSEGYWSNEHCYTFTIRPPWWKTWWAYTAWVLVILGGIGAVIYFVLENQRKKIRLIIHERNRIARELHDDIGAELTRITILSQSLQRNKNLEAEIQVKLRKIAETGKKVLGSIGEIIWTMNPQKDNLDSLASYIRRFVTDYFETNDIDLEIEFPNEIPANAISDEYRRNVFLVIKEAISNISKYSKATSVKLTLNINEKLAAFEIVDNGAGFSVSEQENHGNGLRNMHQRMKDIGGTFLITSEIDRGTSIRLTFPVR